MPDTAKPDSETINGSTLDGRLASMVGEITARHDTEAICRHHLGVCYEEYAALRAENERLRLEVIGQTAARRAFQQILSDHTTQCGPCTDAIHQAMNIAEQAREGGES